MQTILHISDLHFGPPLVPPVAEALLRVAADLRPTLVVASGDFTQTACDDEFRAARAFLDQLPGVPTVVTPGNHDVPPLLSRVLAPFAGYRRHIRDELDYHLRLPGAAVVALNSVSALGSLLNGWLSAGQLDYCSRVFAASPPEDLRVVVAHHQLAPAPDLRGGRVMYRARRAIAHFSALKVDLILGGHLHRTYIGNSLDFYPASRDHGIIVVQCGTTTSRRGRGPEREKNTFNLIRTTADTVEVWHYLYFSEVGGFEVTSQHVFPRAAVGSIQAFVAEKKRTTQDTN